MVASQVGVDEFKCGNLALKMRESSKGGEEVGSGRNESPGVERAHCAFKKKCEGETI